MCNTQVHQPFDFLRINSLPLILHGKTLRMFDFYEAETKNGKKLEFRKLHELESGAVTRVAELLAQEWEERTAAGQVTFRHGDEIV